MDHDWLAAGFTAEQAKAWQRWRIDLAAAVAWRAAGVTEPLAATQWAIAGVQPHGVRRWRAAGIEPAEAVRWHEMGFRLESVVELKRQGLTPEQAMARRGGTELRTFAVSASGAGQVGTAWLQRFHQEGVRPDVWHTYLVAHWLDDEALTWAKRGIQALDAKLWKTLHLGPAEAGRLAAKGSRPEQVIRDWWQAGIPYQEVADWIGTGLSAAEAAAQRARGLTPEQARRGGEDDL